MEDVFESMELSRDSAIWIARGLRAAAAIDGLHAHEVDLIDAFDLDLGVSGEDRPGFDPTAPSPLRTRAEREAFLHSLLLLFLADGQMSDKEEDFLRTIARAEGIDSVRLHQLDRAARMSALAQFRGVRAAREQAESIGRALGLTLEEIEAALSV
jgi:hypothetical protein